MNIIEKILEPHIVERNTAEGELGIRIDQTLTQDATGTMAYLEFEAVGLDDISTELSVSYVDHNTLQVGFENADDHKYLETVAARYGLYFSKAGNGICHQVHLERFAVPGKTLLGSDSHTPTAGGICSFAVGAGGLDVACALGGEPFYMPVPRVIKITLDGKRPDFVSAKDIILKILGILTTKGNSGYVIEYAGSGIGGLSVPERATIANMGAELGVTTSVFPSDKVTMEFMRAQGREKDFREITADAGAVYEKEIDIDLGGLKPMAALPHSPDNVSEVEKIEGIRVNQVLIGSCTNSSYKDLYTVSRLLKGKKAAPGVSFAVAPGSRQVLEMLSRGGFLSDIISSGARLLESSCGFCIGIGQSPGTDAVSLRTNNRNFLGRSGTMSAGVYLVSPETAVASALTGRITDPSKYFGKGIAFRSPKKFIADDSLVISPPPREERQKVRVVKGPNIGPPPENSPLEKDLKARAAIKVGDKVTTDHIMPAGQYLKYRSNIGKYSEYVFAGLDSGFSGRCADNRSAGFANIIIGGESYGQGSSREHAAICPMFLGVKAVIVKSIERIHRANLINFGIAPLIFDDRADYDRIQPGDHLECAGFAEKITGPGTIELENRTRSEKYLLRKDFSAREAGYLAAGGKLNTLRKKTRD